VTRRVRRLPESQPEVDRWVERVQSSIESMRLENARAVRKMRESYETGRWAHATPAERARTRRYFQIKRAQIRELRVWLEAHR
jgi:hypothetical protein